MSKRKTSGQSYLRLVFDKAVEWQLVDSNPCTGIKRHAEHKRTRYLTHAEFQAIRAEASDNIRAILDITYLPDSASATYSRAVGVRIASKFRCWGR